MEFLPCAGLHQQVFHRHRLKMRDLVFFNRDDARPVAAEGGGIHDVVKVAQDAISLPVAAGLGPSGQRPRRAKNGFYIRLSQNNTNDFSFVLINVAFLSHRFQSSSRVFLQTMQIAVECFGLSILHSRASPIPKLCCTAPGNFCFLVRR
ncbi:MAG: hypothetical protein ACXW3Q_11985 [Rhodoplanes sp.]